MDAIAIRRALVALSLVAIVTAVVLATPIPVLALTDGVVSRAVWLDDGDRYRYSHVGGTNGAIVEVRYLRSNDRLRATSVRSTDREAVRSFGWPGEIRDVGGAWEQSAPSNQTRRIEIAVTPAARQRITADRWTVDLAEWFGGGTVLATAERLPVVSALLRGWRP